MKSLSASVLLAALGLFGALGGCTTVDRSGPGDAGALREACSLKVDACVNNCFKVDLGLGCRLCCESEGRSCDSREDYSFSSCLDKSE